MLYREDVDGLKKKLALKENEKVVLHVTPNFNHEIKGGKYVVELAKRMPNVRFVIIGFNGNVKELPKNVYPIAFTKDQEELARYYSLADVTLLTSKKETFSMVCAESLCCGTPVVGFKAGAPETISLSDYSEFVEYGNVEGLQTAIEKWLCETDINKQKISKEAIPVYASEKMVEGYCAVYRQMVAKSRDRQ